jgi:hypothetical protein
VAGIFQYSGRFPRPAMVQAAEDRSGRGYCSNRPRHAHSPSAGFEM